MEVPELTLKLIILLTPGAVASIIFEKLTLNKKWNSFKFIAHSILFGGISYLLAQLIFSVFGSTESFNSFWLNLPSKEIPFTVVLKAMVTSVFIGFLCSGINNYKLINRIARRLNLTRKYGDENLYYHFLNTRSFEKVYFKDIPHGITYQGILQNYSESDEFKEIVLKDVKVYNYTTSEFLYELGNVYLSRPKDNIVLEVPLVTDLKSNKNVEVNNI